MSDKSKIEWTEATWNPIRGCSRISEGCRNCYAETIANRFKGEGLPYQGLIASSGRWNNKVIWVEDLLTQPLHWKKPRRIFVNSMSDLFHQNIPMYILDKIFAVMLLAQQHTFQVLTKRADEMHHYLTAPYREKSIKSAAWEILGHFPKQKSAGMAASWPLNNIWLGVSVEDQVTAERRIPLLLKSPAALRWISAEPILGPLDIAWSFPDTRTACCHKCGYRTNQVGGECPNDGETLRGDIGLDWVVAGGESGKNARPMQPEWIRSLRDQCVAAQVPFFFKQWGEHGLNWYNDNNGQKIPNSEWVYRAGKKNAGRELDGCTWDEYPTEAATCK